MSSINDSLSPDLLFNIFKRLNCIETTRIRIVCKQWLEIIDEHQSFWRILHLPHKSVKKWDPSILELFDRKSGSTLQDVEIGVEVEMELQTQFFDILERSKATLKHLLLGFELPCWTDRHHIFDSLFAVESLRELNWYQSSRVCLRRKSTKGDSHGDGTSTASPLKVLWYGFGRSILEMNIARFSNLVSLDCGAGLSSSEWRTFLEDLSKSLKHLRISFENGRYEDHSGVSPLEFPNMEVLVQDNAGRWSGGRFPQWLLIPDSAKLIVHHVSNLPSISELWTWDLSSHRDDIINHLPKLKTLCLLGLLCDMDDVLEILEERRDNVEADLQVDGVKMGMIKTVVLPFSLSDPGLSNEDRECIRKCKELVEVVEEDSGSRFIEVEF